MDTKLEARGQFPATFPETFKNFFEMMNEDEDHVEIFANLLEDKVIPRQNKSMYSQRQRCGGSLRSHSSGERNSERERNRDRDKGRSNLQQQQQYPNPLQQQMAQKPRSRSGSISDMSQGDGIRDSVGYGNRLSGSSVVVVGRSNSFRMNRQPRQSLSFSSSGIDHIGYGGSCPDGGGSLIDVAGRGEQPMHAERDCGVSLGKSGNLLCKHIKYCCLHHPTQQSPAVDGQQQSLPCDAVASCSGNKLQRLGPDGEDNSTSLRIGVPQIPPRHTSAILDSAHEFPADCFEAEPAWVKRSVVTDDALFRSVQWSNALYNHHPSISSNVDPEPHSISRSRLRFWQKMLGYFVQCRRAYTTCDENDALNGSPTAPVPSPAPHQLAYNVLKPILKQPQPQQQHQLPAPIQSQAVIYHHHHQQQQPTQSVHHRILPIPPTRSGLGAFHTREAALQRVQQQSGLGSRSNLNANYGGYNMTEQQLQPHQQLNQAQQKLVNVPYNRDNDRDVCIPGGGGRELPTSPTTPTRSSYGDFLNAAHPSTSRSHRNQKSPILSRRRSSSIVSNLLHTDHAFCGVPVGTDDLVRSTNTRDRGGVLTFQQAMSGAVSPQYGGILVRTGGPGGGGTGGNFISEFGSGHLGACSSTLTLAAVAEDATTSGPEATDSPPADSSDEITSFRPRTAAPCATNASNSSSTANATNVVTKIQNQSQQYYLPTQRERGVGEVATATSYGTALPSGPSGSVAMGSRMAQKQRMRTSSMPAESRKPRLADTRRAAIHCGDLDMEYYRLRSFSITSHGVCNLGDSLRSRRSRSINSVTSNGTSNSGMDRHNSNASRTSADVIDENKDPSKAAQTQSEQIPAYKIAMLGASSVGKTTLTYQFTTSDYICAYDLSLDDEYGQKTVSVLVDNIETDLEIVDHPACEMSTESFCATYNIDLFVVVYSVVDRNTFKAAEKTLQYLKENEMLLTRGAILVGNKTDLERHRQVTRQMGRKVAKEIACKFIEVSSGLDHNVDELLVGVVAQVKLNPQRLHLLSSMELERLNFQTTIQNHRHMHLPARQLERQMSICQGDDDNQESTEELKGKSKIKGKGKVRKAHRRTLNLESILKMGDSELEDEESSEGQRLNGSTSISTTAMTKFELLTANMRLRRPFSHFNGGVSSKKRCSYDSSGPSTSQAAAAGLQRRHLRPLDNSEVDRNSDHDNFYDYEEEDTDKERNLDAENKVDEKIDCNRKVVSKLTARTKVFLASVLRFKKAINMRRRNSSSCSDLFVI